MTRIPASTSSANVAEFIFAKKASHMVASLSLLNLCTTHWAENDSILSLSKAFKTFLNCALTRGTIAMPVFSAAKANCMGTLWALHLLCFQVLSNHISIAVRLGTKTGQRITFDNLFSSKVEEFLQNLFVIVTKDAQ